MPERFLAPRVTRRGGSSNSSPARETRILRDRQAAHEDAVDRATATASAFSSARMLVQVFNGGSMPATVPRVYYTHPVVATGAETEGGAPTFSADTVTTVPVIFLNHVPSVGDYATAYAVGGRWVAEETPPSSGGSIVCSPCNLPITNLTISWTNPLTGNGSATLIYSASPQQWLAQCVDNGLTFKLLCTGGGVELQATYYTSGGCPGGTSQYCSNLRSSPVELTLSSSTCSPLNITFTVGASMCPQVYSLGNTQFVVTL